jgi:acyl-coenzyme A thioesterase 9
MERWADNLHVWHVPSPPTSNTNIGEAQVVDRSYLEVVFPIATNPALRNAWMDLKPRWNPLRLGKFFEVLDYLSADAAERHTGGVDINGEKISLVTAGHFDAMKLAPSSLSLNLTVKVYCVKVGRSSIEVRTDVIQGGKLIHFAHTVMVALNSEMTKTVAVCPLDVSDTADSQSSERAAISQDLGRHREARRQQSTALHQDSAPPLPEEMAELHSLFKATTLAQQSGDTVSEMEDLVPMASTTVTSSMVIFPEDRNLHGKLFGGFIAQHAFEQAYCAAYTFTGTLPVPLGFDEMIFERPVSIGDLVRFETHVVQTKDRVMRVWVQVKVLDPRQPDLVQTRTNKLSFVFLLPLECKRKVVPDSYAECLRYVSAERWL